MILPSDFIGEAPKYIVKYSEDLSAADIAIYGTVGALLGRKGAKSVRAMRKKYLAKKGLKGKVKSILESPQTLPVGTVAGALGGVTAKKKLQEFSKEQEEAPKRFVKALEEHEKK